MEKLMSRDKESREADLRREQDARKRMQVFKKTRENNEKPLKTVCTIAKPTLR